MTVAPISQDVASEVLSLGDVAREIQLVEEELHLQLKSQSDLVESVAKHTLMAGGKRMRPAFVAIGARSTGLHFDASRARRVGAAMEMIHMATLIHDDVIDNSATRRGRPTAAAVFGNRASILSGDALLAKATALLSQDSATDLITTVSQAVVDMAEGEVREVEVRGDFDLSEKVHLDILQLKTASFIEACCEAGAILAGAGDDVREALSAYGRHVGLAFQIVDDLLDYRGDLRKTGKPLATDFKEGQATLPLIYLKSSLTETESAFVRRHFGADTSDVELKTITRWMDERGAFAACENLAARHVKLAMDAVESLPDRTAKDLLLSVAEHVLSRQS